MGDLWRLRQTFGRLVKLCGRFNLTDSPAVKVLLEDLSIDLGELPTQYNIAPTENILTIRFVEGGYEAAPMRWWLVPSWSDGPTSRYAMFNARAETLNSSKAYRKPFQRQRAIVPVSGFIEWQRTSKGKIPFEISHRDGEALLFAALWDVWEGGAEPLYSCTIVTTEARESFAEIHHRQPLMLSVSNAMRWMDPARSAVDVEELLKPASTAALKACAIEASVNHAANKEPTVGVHGEDFYFS